MWWANTKRQIGELPTGSLVAAILVVAVVLTLVVELLAADIYRATVQVTESGAMGINPLDDALDFGDIPQGAAQTRFVTLANDGSRPAYVVVWTLGRISELLEVDRSTFRLDGGQTARVGFALDVPPSAPARGYDGLVFVFRLPYVQF